MAQVPPLEVIRTLDFDDPLYQQSTAIDGNDNSSPSIEEEHGLKDIKHPPEEDPEAQRFHFGDDGKPERVAVEQERGVTRIEALYLVFGKGWGIYSLWASIGRIAYVYALSRSTTAYYAAFATSAFGEHTIIGTIGVVNGILNGVTQPFIAKMADVWSRPHALIVAVTCYVVGYAMCAGAQNVSTVVAGQLIYTFGNSGITFLNSLIIADITSLQWRAFVDGAINLPYVVNAFVAGYITSGINAYSANGWRWGYGMFCILLPVCISPAIIVLLIGDHRAKKLGTISLAASSVAQRKFLAGQGETKRRSLWQNVRFYWTRLNVFGLLLMGFGFALLLTPMTLNTTAKGGYGNPSLIAMLVVGGILFISWCVWDMFYAEYPFIPKRVLNRTFMACVGIDFFYFFSQYLLETYFSSWVYVIVDYSDRDYTFFSNTLSVTMCSLAIFTGLAMRLTHRFKMLQIGGLCVRCIGMGLAYMATKNPSTAVLVCCRVLMGIGGAISITSSWVAVQGSVTHQDMGVAVAVLNLWSSIGSSISIAISSSVWNREVPRRLQEALGDTYNPAELAAIFGSIYVARATEPRDLIKTVYMEAVQNLYLSALIVSFGAVIAACFASNYFLGQAHNSIETDKIIKFRSQQEIDEELAMAKVLEEKKERATEGVAQI
ncbi:hypothetical protein B9479_001934 [Cryptococcus floricola]|uniref:Major facilitator superfamily (MFS) profile domain-containing protein n=1 Tax=Cryptococcus floricola TaxID=2591691 RepID=A0A5D3B3H4_9TREE|nr:hypothetical protein B9479_001934 [Cryptococcus floricola]